MSDEEGEIRVVGFSVSQERSVHGYDRSRRTSYYVEREPIAQVQLDMLMDSAGLQRFYALMEQIVPGFRRQHASSVPVLPETTRMLPRGPIDAEFVDE